MMMEWLHTPGFLPRPVMRVLRELPAKSLQKLRAATPEGRFWLCVTPGQISSTELPKTLQTLFPQVRAVRAPVHVPAGNRGVQPEPAVDLWLLELVDARREPAGKLQP